MRGSQPMVDDKLPGSLLFSGGGTSAVLNQPGSGGEGKVLSPPFSPRPVGLIIVGARSGRIHTLSFSDSALLKAHGQVPVD